ncbi:hypothetical protein LINPERPRIM_LOCUS38102 [Linum perenne]
MALCILTLIELLRVEFLEMAVVDLLLPLQLT